MQLKDILCQVLASMLAKTLETEGRSLAASVTYRSLIDSIFGARSPSIVLAMCAI